MSYDLMVFEPSAAPKDRAAFLEWYDHQTAWSEKRDYNDPAGCSPALRAWFDDITRTFPPMNGPLRSTTFDSNVTDYSIGTVVIYAAFRWSVSEAAYAAVTQKAKLHAVGFYNVSGEYGEVCAPTPGSGYACLHHD